MSPSTTFEEVAELRYANIGAARSFTEGWQSWSVTESLSLDVAPYRATLPDSLIIDCQDREVPDVGTFQGSGLLAIDPGNNGPIEVFEAISATSRLTRIRASRVGNHVIVAADGPVHHESDDGPGGLQGALCRFADRFARTAGMSQPLRAIPSLWCSWYGYFKDVTAIDVRENLVAMQDLGLDVAIVQIDDGYEAAAGDWLIPSVGFDNLSNLLHEIRDSGRRAGIWIAPTLVGLRSQLANDHPDWLVRSTSKDDLAFAGEVVGDRCGILDLTHPGAVQYLTDVLGKMRAWGIDYFKADFLYAGALPGRRHLDMTDIEAYRQGLTVIRDAIGPESLLLGCGAPILPSVGLVDAMRVGPDIAATYAPTNGHPSMPSQANAARNSKARAYQHGRFWINDPDCLIATPSTERREDWAEVVESFGGVRASGDRLRSLDAWGLATTRRLLVDSPTTPICPAVFAKEE